MKHLVNLGHFCGFLAAAILASADSTRADEGTTPRWITNRPAVFTAPEVAAQQNSANPTTVRKRFDHYQPDSLNNVIWTNFVAHTNGRDMTLWTTRSHPIGWPARAPVVAWNPRTLIWGMKGMTALSPCWEVEGSAGQVPVTALTRRHAYTRGHGMGSEGLNENFAKKKIWFVTTNNSVVEATVLRDFVRAGSKGDYTILLLSRDLPPGIEPMAVVSLTSLYRIYPQRDGAPRPMFRTEQGGHVSAEVEEFNIPKIWKPGDSGSPDMLPMPGELFFINGRSTTGPDAGMQAAMDELSTSAHLDPKKYQLRWLNLSDYPSFD